MIKSRNVYNNAKTNYTLTFFVNSHFYFFTFRVLWFDEENAQVGFAWLTPTHATCVSQTRYKIQQCEHATFETCVL